MSEVLAAIAVVLSFVHLYVQRQRDLRSVDEVRDLWARAKIELEVARRGVSWVEQGDRLIGELESTLLATGSESDLFLGVDEEGSVTFSFFENGAPHIFRAETLKGALQAALDARIERAGLRALESPHGR